MIAQLDGRSCSIDDALVHLIADGVVVVRQAMPEAHAVAVDRELAMTFQSTPASRGGFYGDRTVRFGSILRRSPTFLDFVISRVPSGLAATALAQWHPSSSLSFAQAVAIHPGSPMQVPHRDGEMWPVPPTEAEHLISVMWPLTPFDSDNGGTVVWPRSHRAGGGDQTGQEPVQVPMRPGDALVFLGSTRHAGGANRTNATRRGIVVGYAASWLVPAENPMLAYPPDVARAFPPEIAALVGYRRYAPNLNNYDCRCPSELLDGDGPGRGAVDELSPEHVSALARFTAVMAS